MDGSPGLRVPSKATPQSKLCSGTGPDELMGGAGPRFLPLPLTGATGSPPGTAEEAGRGHLVPPLQFTVNGYGKGM